MRADRLLSMILILQTQGRSTAQKLAAKLEVSERTIYRDLSVLSSAGFPVYAERGPGGGVELLDSFRTTLTGLTPQEARALFMLGSPQALEGLGLSQSARSALLKLAASLPEARRAEESLARQRIYLDPSGWGKPANSPPALPVLQQALWQERRLRLVFRSQFSTRLEQEIEPLGLAAKLSEWYLVYQRQGRLRVLKTSAIEEAELLPQPFTRPPEFDLATFWQSWCAESALPRYSVIVRVSPELRPVLGQHLQGVAFEALAEEAQGWARFRLEFESFEQARTRLLGLGRAVEALEPLALRRSIADYAEQVLELYRSK